MTAALARVDGSLYLRMPRVNALSGITLARAILIALPKSAPPSVKHAAREMRANAVELQSAHMAEREAPLEPASRSKREIDNEADALHGAIRRRLEDYQSVKTRDPELAERAAALAERLYPKSSNITQGSMHTQWQATELWFATLAKEGREATLRALVGDVYVDALKATHAEYGHAIGTTKPLAAGAEKVDIAAPLAALIASMQDVALQLVAVANDGSATPELRGAARDALRPIDDLRDGNARRSARRGGSDDEPTPAPDGPLPDVR